VDKRRTPHRGPAHRGRTARWSSIALLVGLVVCSAGLTGCLFSATAAKKLGAGSAPTTLSCPQRLREATVYAIDPDSTLDDKWTSYVDSNTGWTGGDSVHAYAVPQVGTLWTFSDSFETGVLPDNHRSGYIINNVFVVQTDKGYRLITGGTPEHPTPIVADKDRYFYLLLAGIVEGPVFQGIFMERRQTGHASLDNYPVGAFVGTFAIPSFKLLRLTPVPNPSPTIQWGSFVDQIGSWIYVYGASSYGYDKSGFIARVAGSNLQGTWSYWTGHGWSGSVANAAPVLHNVDTQYSVTPFDGMYVFLTSQSEPPFSPYANLSFGCSPTGPFVNAKRFTLSTEVGPVGEKTWGDPSVYVYDAQVQTALNTGGHLVISYNQNSINVAAIMANVSLYRPRYLNLYVGLTQHH